MFRTLFASSVVFFLFAQCYIVVALVMCFLCVWFVRSEDRVVCCFLFLSTQVFSLISCLFILYVFLYKFAMLPHWRVVLLMSCCRCLGIPVHSVQPVAFQVELHSSYTILFVSFLYTVSLISFCFILCLLYSWSCHLFYILLLFCFRCFVSYFFVFVVYTRESWPFVFIINVLVIFPFWPATDDITLTVSFLTQSFPFVSGGFLSFFNSHLHLFSALASSIKYFRS